MLKPSSPSSSVADPVLFIPWIWIREEFFQIPNTGRFVEILIKKIFKNPDSVVFKELTYSKIRTCF
jgi:hypothetical protein